MRIKRILSLLTAMGICAACVPAVSAAEEKGFTADIGVCGNEFHVQSWKYDANISEGQNTLTCYMPADSKGKTTSIHDLDMLVVDLNSCYYEVGEIRVDDIYIDGEAIEFDESAIIYGANDGKDNDDFRIEIFSVYGETKNAPPFDPKTVTVNESVSVTFSVSREGYSGGLKKLEGNVVANKNSSSPVPMTSFSVSVTTSDKDKSYDPSNVTKHPCAVDKDRFSAELKRGIYDITVSKKGFAPREFKDVRVGKTDLSQFKDIDLRAYGDINGDGVVDVKDVTLIASYVKGTGKFSDDYQSAVADCTHDGAVNVKDVSLIASYTKGFATIK